MASVSNQISTYSGDVIQSVKDGYITWLKIKSLEGVKWQGYLAGELVGVLPSTDENDNRLFSARRAYQVVNESGTDRITFQTIAAPVNPAIPPSLTVAQSAKVFGVELDVEYGNDILGYTDVYVTDLSGELLTTTEVWREGKIRLGINYAELTNVTAINVHLNAHAGQIIQTVNLDVDTSGNIAIESADPAAAGAILTQGAQVPIITQYAESARIVSQYATQSDIHRDLIPNEVAGYRWVRLDESPIVNFTLHVNDSAQDETTISSIPNLVSTSSSLILSPINNVTAKEGDLIEINYSFTAADGEEYRYTEVGLFDFNNNRIAEILSGEFAGNLTIRLPNVDELDTYFIRVRHYYNDSYAYIENEVGIRIAPQLQVPAPVISGITSQAFVGSELQLDLAVGVGALNLNTLLEVFDAQGVLLDSDPNQIIMVVPEGIDYLTIIATVSDDFGNSRVVERQITIVSPITPSLQKNSELVFDVLLPDVGNAWLARGRYLLDQEYVLQTELESEVSAMARLGDRLLIALSDQRLIIVDPAENFQVVGTYQLDSTIIDLVVYGNNILTIDQQRNLRGFTTTGNEILPENLRIGNNVYQQEELATKVIATKDGFAVLFEESVAKFDQHFIASQANTIATPDGSSIVYHSDVIFVGTNVGKLFAIYENNTIREFTIGINADQLIRYGNYLIALADSLAGTSATFINVINPGYPEKIATYQLQGTYALGEAKLFRGQIFFGDIDGAYLDFDIPDNSLLKIYADENARGQSSDVAMEDGYVLSAANEFGAQILAFKQGQWQSSQYPVQSYTQSSQRVAVDAGIAYLAQHDQRRVISLAVDGLHSAGTVFSEIVATQIDTTIDYVVATSGSDIHLAEKRNPNNKSVISLPLGEDIVSLATFGETIFVSTNNRRLYRIVPGALPFNLFSVKTESIIDGAADVIEDISSSGQYVFFRVDKILHKLNLNTFVDTTLELLDSTAVFTMEYGEGYVWVGDSDGVSIRLRPIDIASWFFVPDVSYELSERITAIDIDRGMISLAKGASGIEILDLGKDLSSVNSALLTPAEAHLYVQGNTINLSLSETYKIAAVNYFINGKLVTGTNLSPFNTNILVPPTLRNGQPFEITAEIETIDGAVITSQPREVLLQGENLPANGFAVSIVTPSEGQASFVPKPLEIRAIVNNSSQPVDQVEYYEADSANGPFRIIGKHYGPEYVIFRDYGVEDSGKFIQVRAIDIFGNSTKSQTISFERHRDDVLPLVSAFHIDGPILANNEIVGEHSFTLNTNVSDPQSGIESAILRRNGVIVAAIFEDGPLQFVETTAEVGQTLTYAITVKDKAGNSQIRQQTYTIVEDTEPHISNFELVSPAVYEQGEFVVRFSADDQVAIVKVELIWNGFTTAVPFLGSSTVKQLSLTQSVRDQRTHRIGTALLQPLVLRVTDDIGQVAEQVIQIELQPDLPPDLSLLNIDVRSNDFYGNNISVDISNINFANEGSNPVRLEVIEVSPNDGAQVYETATKKDNHRLTIKLPGDDIHNDEYQFVIRLTDHLGQAGDSLIQRVALTREPNELRFFKSFDQTSLNPVTVSVDDSSFYQVEVIDYANRRVPHQSVNWILTSVNTGGLVANISLGVTTSDDNGLALLPFNSKQITGLYTIRAELSADPRINTERRIRIDSGVTAILEIDVVDVVRAGELFTLDIVSRDRGGNFVSSDSISELTISIPFNGFNFGFANNTAVTRLYGGGEQAIITMQNGRANISVSSITQAGVYPISLESEDGIQPATQNNENYVETNSHSLQVIFNEAYQIKLVAQSRTNHPFGESSRLEAGEAVTISATLVDQYQNEVSQFSPLTTPQSADLSMHLNIDGSAVLVSDIVFPAPAPAQNISGGSADNGTNIVSMKNGYGEFTVSNEEIEIVTVAIAEVTSDFGHQIPDSLEHFDSLSIDFEKRKPAIIEQRFVETINSEITPLVLTYSEQIVNNISTESPIAEVSLDQELIEGEFTVDSENLSNLITFAPNTVPVLSRCYQIDTVNSTWQGSLVNDNVLTQALTACSFDAVVSIPEYRYVLEGTETDIQVRFGNTPLISSNSTAEFVVGRVDSVEPLSIVDTNSFTFNSNGQRTIAIPEHTSLGLADGQQLAIYVNEDIPNFSVGNQLWLTVLQRNGDYDEDGLSNELEFEFPEYDPVSIDTDENGVSDGDEDFDGDGLSNTEELEAGSDLRLVDTDNDGVTDFDEVNIHLSNPNLTDTDGDGLSDFVEVISGSDPTSEFDISVDPFFVTSISVTPDRISQILSDNNTRQINVTATFVSEGRTEQLPMAALGDLLEYTSQNSTIASVDIDGIISLLSAGETTVTVNFIENPSLNVAIPITLEQPVQSNSEWLYIFNGDSAGDEFGRSASGAGDVNGDGYDDIIVGAPYDDNNGEDAGSARVLSGFDGSVIYNFDGNAAGDNFGISVSGAGDVNNDGYDDLLVGASGDDTKGPDVGAAFVFSGLDGTILHSFYGEADYINFGYLVGGAGDVNADGYHDLIVMAQPISEYGSDNMLVYSGEDGTLLYAFISHRPTSVGSARDFNADGHSDLIVYSLSFGTGGFEIVTLVYSGKDQTVLDRYYSYDSSSFSRDILSNATGLGDINNDGYDDIAILHIAGGYSELKVLSGKTKSSLYNSDGYLYTLGENISDAYVIQSFDVAGDVNGDGYQDIILGVINSPSDEDNTGYGEEVGYVQVYSGVDGSLLSNFQQIMPSDGMGYVVGGAGDFDGDGLAEILIGFHGDDSISMNAGSVRVSSLAKDWDGDGLLSWEDPVPLAVSNETSDYDQDGLSDYFEIAYDLYPTIFDSDGDRVGDGDEINIRHTDPFLIDTDGDGLNDGEDTINPWNYFFNGKNSYSNFGVSVSNAGDVNGDGHEDVIVGASGNSPAGFYTGAATIFSGQNGFILHSFLGENSYDYFGQSVSGVGDVNNDGYSDVVVGAFGNDANGSDAGAVTVFSGADGTSLYTIYGQTAYGNFGGYVEDLGDVNGDGRNDFIAGNLGAPAIINIYSGADGTRIKEVVDSANEGVDKILSVSGSSDVNNDGLKDLIIGISHNDGSANTVSVFSGENAELLYSINSDSSETRFGQSVSGIGDIDGDGFDDILIGEPYRKVGVFNRAGVVSIYSGFDGSEIDRIEGQYTNEEFGNLVKQVGDVDGDQITDLVISARRGKSYNDLATIVYSGVDRSILYSFDVSPTSVSAAGDIDNDGRGDMIFGFTETHNIGPQSGSARIYSLSHDWDGDEISSLVDPQPLIFTDATPDFDGDGLLFNLELLHETDSHNADTDGDGLSDGDEVRVYFTNPKVVDTDNDGISDNEDRINEWTYFITEGVTDEFGISVSDAGDVNGDGYGDFIVGSPGANISDYRLGTIYGAGSAIVYSGVDSSEIYRFNGDTRNFGLGVSVSGAGDINNDGFDDVAVGARRNASTEGASGSVRIFSGKDGSILYEFEGEAVGDKFGVSVGGAGDTNGDGHNDIVVGADQADNNKGIVYIFSGKDGSTLKRLSGESDNDYFGGSVSGAGDVNADGHNDVVVGARGSDSGGNESGSVYVYSGLTGAELFKVDGGSPYDKFGLSVSGVGDVNSDGFSDVIAGANNRSINEFPSVSVQIISGQSGSTLYTLYEKSWAFTSGLSVSGVGDIDADGVSDIVIGVPGDNGTRDSLGTVNIYSGKSGSKLYQLEGVSPFDSLGYSVSGAGDLDGDGSDEIIVGAYSPSNNSFASGSVRVYSLTKDWDNDGYQAWEDPLPLIFTDLTTDLDADGLTDFYEFNNGLNPRIEDTDSDGLDDGDEVNLYLTNPKNPDGDGDGLNDGDEVIHNANPFISDTDDDGLTDGQEVNQYGSSPLVVDTDEDGISDLNEAQTYHSNPSSNDSDSDGYTDYDEIYVYHTDPRLSDTDGDGVNDPLDLINEWLYFVNGNSYNDNLGASVSSAGDVNADGYDDFIIGAPHDNNSTGNTGTARVYSGLDGTILNVFNGTPPHLAFGTSVSGAGDVNGDGYADVVIGAVGGSSISGSVQIFSGEDGSVLYTFFGESVNDKFGGSVSGAGDVNGDGYDDVIIGASRDDSAGRDAGSARIISGLDGSVLQVFYGDSPSDNLGNSVGVVGDVNGDGYGDVIVGAYRDGSGSASVYSGVDGTTIFKFNGESNGDQFGWSVSGAGDVNGDSYPDVVVGANYDDNSGVDSGSVYIYSGIDGAILYRFNGDSAYDYFGYSVSGLGDIDGDGFGEVIVGITGSDVSNSGSGTARVFSGKEGAVLYDFHGIFNNSLFRFSVSNLGDLDGDGYNELIIGSRNDSTAASRAGSARVYSLRADWDSDGYLAWEDPLPLIYTDEMTDVDGDGLTDIFESENDLDPLIYDIDGDGVSDGDELNLNNTDPKLQDTDGDGIKDGEDLINDWLYFFNGKAPSYFGYSVNGAGDVNGDGFVDFIVGAPREDNYTGSVYIYSGKDRLLLHHFKGFAENDYFGESVSELGDINLDGYADVIVGAHRADTNGTNAGSAYIFSGQDGTILYTFEGENSYDYFGRSVDFAGDTNGDGYPDLIIGAYGYNSTGSVQIYSGQDGRILHRIDGSSYNREFGYSVSGAGDVNADGYDDVVIGAYLDDSSGSASVYSGIDASLLYVFKSSSNDYRGLVVSGAGDVNADGHADVIVGVYRDDTAGRDAGSAQVFSGKTGLLLYEFNGDSEYDYFGIAVGEAGDVNGDGYSDVVVGATGDSREGRSSGSANIFSGKDGSVVYRVYGDSDFENLGISVNNVGDIDGDGSDEIIIGASFDSNNGNRAGSARVYSLNKDWDNDGYFAWEDPVPLAYTDVTTDFDQDGLTDFYEFENELDAEIEDTDGDGISDGDEVNVHGTNPLIEDTDGDGLLDGEEIIHSANPLSADTDNDGLNDGEEVNQYRSNPIIVDTDEDGLADGVEVYDYAISPTVIDTDNDGLTDYDEIFVSHTDPKQRDTDGDGVNDGVSEVNDWLYFFNGHGRNDLFGYSVSDAGDVNGDGYADVIVGASLDAYYGNRFGRARVLSGQNNSVIYTFNGASSDEYFGYSVSGAGDVNADGYDDLIVGAYRNDEAAQDAGSATVFSGENGSILYKFNGQSANDYFGFSVSNAGDVNNDGYDDVIVGAYLEDGAGKNAGNAQIFSGEDGTVLYEFNGDSLSDYFGYSVSDAGDVNGDGFADVIVGAHRDHSTGSDSGSAKIYSGVDGSILQTFNGNSSYDYLGWSVSGAGDINNDGFDDVIVGATGEGVGGVAHVYSGVSGIELFSYEGDSANDNFGVSVSGVGDVNGDGYDDVIVGASFDNGVATYSGSARVFSGKDGSIIYTFTGENHRDYLGFSVSGAGDMDGDGSAEVIVGVYGDDNADTDSGSARIYSLNKDWDNDGYLTWEDPVPLAYTDVTTDFDQDGLTDFYEFENELDAEKEDTDGDGLSDGAEVNLHGTNPLLADADGDDLTDGEEITHSSNPFVMDTDEDGLNDGMEVNQYGSNPIIVDTDNDGFPDGVEVYDYATNPIVVDTDNDGLTDYDEVFVNHTDPKLSDTDDDGVDDNVPEINDWLYFFNGHGRNDLFGYSVSDAGDVNGDGYADIIVGAYLDDYDGNQVGSARVLSGKDNSVIYTFNGTSSDEYFGYSVSGAGDVNADGYDDLIVGAYLNDEAAQDSGSATVFSGENGSILYKFNGQSANDYFGFSVSNAGDVNNDGYDDVIVGAYLEDGGRTNAGNAQIFSGVDGTVLYVFNGDSSYDYFGYSVSDAGDANGDGFADVIVGAHRDHSTGSDSGSAKIYSGVDGSILQTFNGNSSYDYLGRSVSGAGDINNDGFDDVIVGATGEGVGGVAHVYSGVSGIELFSYEGDSVNDNFGVSVSGVGDVNGDSYDDVIVGASFDNGVATDSGSARVFSGKDGSIIYTFTGENHRDYLGFSVSGAGDMDGDGSAEVIVGVYGDDNADTDSGSARVYSLNKDWDNDGYFAWEDPVPLAYTDVTTDFDQDGLTDFYEFENELDAKIEDTDGDGLSDGVEVNIHTTNPLIEDTDGDGLIDGGEIIHSANPLLADTDNDGLNDGEEVNQYRSNPIIVDTDEDGLADGVEVYDYAINPTVIDTDNDGLTDFDEVFVNHTDPKLSDTDDDGVDDNVPEINDWLYFFNGHDRNDLFGYSVSDAGDVNGDGYADVIVGAFLDTYYGNRFGSARVLSGQNNSVIFTFNGTSSDEYFGYSVSGAGDVNADGYDDLIVGAYRNDEVAQDAGSATIFSGENGSILYKFNGQSTNDYFGFSVSNAGDVNNDGYDDVIVGAYLEDGGGTNAGNAQIFSGEDGTVLYEFNGDSLSDYFGYSVSDAGDVNGDGFADVIVGAHRDNSTGSDSGSAKIYSGIDGSILQTFNGNSSYDYLGWSVSGAGDINNDGFDDVIVGATGEGVGGVAHVYSGVSGIELFFYEGDSANDNFGVSVSGVGDVNGDGYDDVIVGARSDDGVATDSGSARVFSGIDGSIIYTFTGENYRDYMGFSVSGAGDMDGDGSAEVIVGVYGDDNAGTDSGSARVYSLNKDWDGDGLVTWEDPEPLVFNDATTSVSSDDGAKTYAINRGGSSSNLVAGNENNNKTNLTNKDIVDGELSDVESEFEFQISHFYQTTPISSGENWKKWFGSTAFLEDVVYIENYQDNHQFRIDSDSNMCDMEGLPNVSRGNYMYKNVLVATEKDISIVNPSDSS